MKKDSVLQIRLPLETREKFLEYCQSENTQAGKLLRSFIDSCLEGFAGAKNEANQDWVDTLSSMDAETPLIDIQIPSKVAKVIDIDHDIDAYAYFKEMVAVKRFVDTEEQAELLRKLQVRHDKKLLHSYFFPFYELWSIDSDLKRYDAYCKYEMSKDSKGLYQFEALFFRRSTNEQMKHKLFCYYGDKEFFYDSIEVATGNVITSKSTTSMRVVEDITQKG